MHLLEAKNEDALAKVMSTGCTVDSLKRFQITTQKDLTEFLELCQGVFVQTLLTADAYLHTAFGIGKVEAKGAGSIIPRASANAALKTMTTERVIFDFTVTASFPELVGNPPAATKFIPAFKILDDTTPVVTIDGNLDTVTKATLVEIHTLAKLALRDPFGYTATMTRKLAAEAERAARPTRTERAAGVFRSTIESTLPLSTTDELEALGWLIMHTSSVSISVKTKYLGIFDEVFPGQPRSVADAAGELTSGNNQMKYSGSARLQLTDSNLPEKVKNLASNISVDRAGAINNTAFIAGLVNSCHFYFTSRENPFDVKRVFNANFAGLNPKQRISFTYGCVYWDDAFTAWLMAEGIPADAYTPDDVQRYINTMY